MECVITSYYNMNYIHKNKYILIFRIHLHNLLISHIVTLYNRLFQHMTYVYVINYEVYEMLNLNLIS